MGMCAYVQVYLLCWLHLGVSLLFGYLEWNFINMMQTHTLSIAIGMQLFIKSAVFNIHVKFPRAGRLYYGQILLCPCLPLYFSSLRSNTPHNCRVASDHSAINSCPLSYKIFSEVLMIWNSYRHISWLIPLLITQEERIQLMVVTRNIHKSWLQELIFLFPHVQ